MFTALRRRAAGSTAETGEGRAGTAAREGGAEGAPGDVALAPARPPAPVAETREVRGERLAVLAGAVGVPMARSLIGPSDPARWVQTAAELGYPLAVHAGRTVRVVGGPEELRRTIHAISRGKDEEIRFEVHTLVGRIVRVLCLVDEAGSVRVLHDLGLGPIAEAPAPEVSAPDRAALARNATRLASGLERPGVVAVDFGLDSARRTWQPLAVRGGPSQEASLSAALCGLDIDAAEAVLAAGGPLPDTDGGPATDVYACSAVLRAGPAGPRTVRHAPVIAGVTCEWLEEGDGRQGERREGDGRQGEGRLARITALAPGRVQGLALLDRALRDLDVRGMPTNVAALRALLPDPPLAPAESPPPPAPGAGEDGPRLLFYLAEVTVNGQRELRGRESVPVGGEPPAALRRDGEPEPGTRQLLARLGPEGFASWMRD